MHHFPCLLVNLISPAQTRTNPESPEHLDPHDANNLHNEHAVTQELSNRIKKEDEEQGRIMNLTHA
jgi:hypothetical protein